MPNRKQGLKFNNVIKPLNVPFYSQIQQVKFNIHVPIHHFAEILGSKSWVQLIYETTAFRWCKLTSLRSEIALKALSK